MAIIKNPKEIFPQITDDYQKVFGDDLVSIILYGSAAGTDYVPGKSDINFLIVLSDTAIDHLHRTFETVSRWKKKNVATPLFMTESYIGSSLDSFPLEFLNIKINYILVFGKDVLEHIEFEMHHLRLQCERELKGKLLLLREGFLETEGKSKKIKELITASITAFISIFTGLLYLKGIDMPHSRRAVLETVTDTINIDHTVFTQCLDVKEGKGNFSASELMALFQAYLREVRRLWEIVDTLDI